MVSNRRSYSREFKLEAVRQLLEGKKGLAQTARNLQINRTMLSRWRKEYLADPDSAFLGSGRHKPADEDLAQLRREIVELREEREILKKVLAYFGEKKQ
jgi:transposase